MPLRFPELSTEIPVGSPVHLNGGNPFTKVILPLYGRPTMPAGKSVAITSSRVSMTTDMSTEAVCGGLAESLTLMVKLKVPALVAMPITATNPPDPAPNDNPGTGDPLVETTVNGPFPPFN